MEEQNNVFNHLLKAHDEIIKSKDKTIMLLSEENLESKKQIKELKEKLKEGEESFKIVMKRLTEIAEENRNLVYQNNFNRKENIELIDRLNYLLNHKGLSQDAKKDYSRLCGFVFGEEKDQLKQPSVEAPKIEKEKSNEIPDQNEWFNRPNGVC